MPYSGWLLLVSICEAALAAPSSSSMEISPGMNISSSPLPGATMGRQMSGTTLKSTSTGPVAFTNLSMTSGRSSTVSAR